MDKAKKILAPLMALGAALWNAAGAVEAARGAHWGRLAIDVGLALLFVLVAWTLWDTGKRFSDS